MQLALTFYDICFSQTFWQWMYVKKVFGVENIDLNKGLTYHRLGYCPAFLDEANGLIKLGTLLCPGYRETPEYELILKSDLPAGEKARLEQFAVDDYRNHLLRTGDFSALKWFHENGVPQVIQTRTPPYRMRPKGEYLISERIQK